MLCLKVYGIVSSLGKNRKYERMQVEKDLSVTFVKLRKNYCILF